MWRAEYVGCFKIRNAVDARLAQRSHRWYDPHHKVFLGDDTRYAEGPFYVIHGRVIEGIMRSGLLPRAGGPEGANPSPPKQNVVFTDLAVMLQVKIAEALGWSLPELMKRLSAIQTGKPCQLASARCCNALNGYTCICTSAAIRSVAL